MERLCALIFRALRSRRNFIREIGPFIAPAGSPALRGLSTSVLSERMIDTTDVVPKKQPEFPRNLTLGRSPKKWLFFLDI